MQDLIVQAFEAAETLARVEGQDYRLVQVIYGRDKSGSLYQFSTVTAWPETAPGQIAARTKEAEELRAQLSEREGLIETLQSLIVKLQQQLPSVQEKMARTAASELDYFTSLAFTEESAEPALAPHDESEERHAANQAEDAANQAEQPATVADPLVTSVFVVEGINGLKGRTPIPLTDLGNLPIETFRFGSVELSPRDLQAVAARILEGGPKVNALKAMPGYRSTNYGIFNQAYNEIVKRIKPAGYTNGASEPVEAESAA